MVPLSAFRSRIAPRVLTALDLTIDQAVLDTAIDFCEQTLICKELLDPVSTSPGRSDYDLSTNTPDLAIVKITRAWCQQYEMQPLSEDDVDTPFGYTASITGLTPTLTLPRSYHEPAPGQIALLPIPNDTYQLTIRAAVKPKRTATQVQDVLYENWVDAIVDGALLRLYSMPGAQFSNAQLATAHAGLYRQGVNRALIEATRGRTRAATYVRPPPI